MTKISKINDHLAHSVSHHDGLLSICLTFSICPIRVFNEVYVFPSKLLYYLKSQKYHTVSSFTLSQHQKWINSLVHLKNPALHTWSGASCFKEDLSWSGYSWRKSTLHLHHRSPAADDRSDSLNPQHSGKKIVITCQMTSSFSSTEYQETLLKRYSRRCFRPSSPLQPSGTPLTLQKSWH